MLQYLFFDFGGCLDAPGIHTRTLFWEAFAPYAEGRREEFQDAYGDADKKMMATGIAKSLGLREFNRFQGTLIAQAMKISPGAVHPQCDAITERMEKYLKHSHKALKLLKPRYPLGLISNFTGNLQVILEEQGYSGFFDSVTESFYVGASKPELKIFHEALAKQQFRPEECLYVGDNPVNDIAPAKSLGMKAILIHEPGKRRECGADAYVTDLLELPGLIQRM